MTNNDRGDSRVITIRKFIPRLKKRKIPEMNFLKLNPLEKRERERESERKKTKQFFKTNEIV